MLKIKNINISYKMLILISVVFLNKPLLGADISSSIVIAIDYSGSYQEIADLNPENQIAVYDKTFDFVFDLAKELPKDISFKVLPINEFSSVSDVICQARIKKKKLLGNKKKDNSAMLLKDFKNTYADICKVAIMKQEVAPGTDISGTIDLTRKLIRAETNGPVFLIILSDFYEYRSEYLPKFEFDLDGFRVLLLYRTKAFSMDGNVVQLTDGEVKKWKQKFLDSGAKKACMTPENASEFKGQALRCLY